ncbi:IBTK-like protein, partial [Mya arenaria]
MYWMSDSTGQTGMATKLTCLIATSSNRPLPLAVPADVLDVLIENLYTDDATIIAECADAEKLCNILVVADQMLSVRLKQMCEVAIVAL